MYYLGRMYKDDLMVGEDYRKLRRCVSISLLDFELLPDKESCHNIYRLRNEKGEELTDLWEVHRIAQENGRMREVVEVVRQMGLIRTIRWFYDGYWRAKRDRWAEDEYVRD